MKQLSAIILSVLLGTLVVGATPQREVKLDWARSPLILIERLDSPVADAKSNCDCMDVDVVGEGRNELRIKIDATVFAEDSVRTLEVAMEDGATRKLHYHFRVPIALQLNASSLIWERGKPAKPQTLRVRIPDGSPIKNLHDVAMDKQSFTLSTKTLRRGKSYEVSLTPHSTDKPQLVRLIITTDSPYEYYKRYLVYLRVK